jgi:uncharacterized protein (TIGR00375 family)
MQYIADLHLHSKYSRAVSQQMTLPVMHEWGRKKGLDVLATGDWTHPLWFRHIVDTLEEKKEGLYKIKNQKSKIKDDKGPFFLLSTEISCIYSQGGKTRRIHNLILAPSLETVKKINKEMVNRGYNLNSDGRPIVGLSSRNLLEMVLTIDKTALLIPCHVWTPWFALYGSMSGFDSLDECFGDYAKFIFGVETGLSSDPEMNWRIKELANRTILSSSDAHSMPKMGREATVFELEDLTFKNIRRAIIGPSLKPDAGLLPDRIAYTIEFYPEEGKYHYTGHRNCKVIQSPEETKKNGKVCPVCGKDLTVGVMHRVQQLEIHGQEEAEKMDEKGIKWIYDPSAIHPPFVKLVPLLEIIAESLSCPVTSQKAKDKFDYLCAKMGSEMDILLKASIEDIQKEAGERIANGVEKVRQGNIVINPGFDGEYGVVKIWNQEDLKEEEIIPQKSQLGIDF